jgi:hypothetical protein
MVGTSRLGKLRSDGSSPPSSQPGLDSIPVVHCRPDIKMESHVQLILWIGSTGVEIDNISDICSASVNEPVMSVKWRSVSIRQHVFFGTSGKTHPNAVMIQAFGVLSFGLPTKLTSLGPPHLSAPRPASHIKTCSQAFSLTAL